MLIYFLQKHIFGAPLCGLLNCLPHIWSNQSPNICVISVVWPFILPGWNPCTPHQRSLAWGLEVFEILMWDFTKIISIFTCFFSSNLMSAIKNRGIESNVKLERHHIIIRVPFFIKFFYCFILKKEHFVEKLGEGCPRATAFSKYCEPCS